MKRGLGPRAAAAALLAFLLAACGGGDAATPRPPDERSAGASVDAGSRAADGEARQPEPAGQETAGGEEAAEPIVPAPATDGEVLLIDVVEVHEKLASGTPILLIDARGGADYRQEHIPGAVNVPLPKIAATGTLPGVPHDHEIAVYCSTETCPVSLEAVRALASFGYTNVKDMRAGILGWKQAGFDTVRGEEPGRLR